MKVYSSDGKKFLKCVRDNLSTYKSVKQLCEVQHPQVVYCEKEDYCFYAKLIRKTSKEKEIILVLQHVFPPQHLVEFLPCEETDIIYTKAVKPLHENIRTLKDVLKHSTTVPLVVCKSILAQIIALLVYAQEKDCKFAHNDLKADNILVTNEPSPEPLTIGKYQIQHAGVRVIFIDVETVTGTLFPALDLSEIPQKVQEQFGLDPSIPWCSWTDLHLVMLEYWTKVNSLKPSWTLLFQEFLKECMPMKVFCTYNEGNIIMLSNYNRLTKKGRNAINTLISNGQAKDIKEILQLSFFKDVVQVKE
jgi:serine/threonine protein kinase